MNPVKKLLMGSKRSHFNLTKQFALFSALCILLIGAVSAYMLSHLFTESILSRDATVSQEFIDSVIAADETWRFLLNTKDELNRTALEEFFSHVTHMPDVVRANVYGSDKSILWSSSEELIGEHFVENEELDETLAGELTYESSIIGDTSKEEHKDLDEALIGMRFVETYIPIWNGDRSRVVGAVELYKLPRALHQSIVEGQRLIWISALLGGLLLFSTLYWIVERASRVMERQHQQLIETRSLSMIGETASAVAHAMRNPLASIRACAELTLTDDLEGARESAMDIINEADRLDRWARELLQFSATNTEAAEELDLNALIQDVLAEHTVILNRTATRLELGLSQQKPSVWAHHAPLSQILGNLITNAVEAMGEEGRLSVKVVTDLQHKQAIVSIADNGPGLSDEISGKLFRPFATTKPTGTGLGLALSKRLVEHYDGTLILRNNATAGVTAIINLPLAGSQA
jgi:signal transduction histidine kinase